MDLGTGPPDLAVALVDLRVAVGRSGSQRGELFAGHLRIDFGGGDGARGEDRDAVIDDLYESAVDIVSQGRLWLDDPHLTESKPTDHWAMQWSDTDFTVE
jgi:hypothetical protein